MVRANRNLYFLLSFILFALCFAGCTKKQSVKLVDLDLMSYEMPIMIKAPADAEIKKMDLIVQKDITVKSGDGFYLQIFESDVTNRDPKKVKEDLLKTVQENPYFSELVQEDPNGFIYKTQIDSTQENYSFRYVRIQGDKEYTFQTGMIGQFTLDQVRTMYNAVK